jgi:murein DD-endopeptidase MepM/ murein hydrolase activator NlpD
LKRALKKRVQAELESTPSDDAPVEHIDTVHLRVNQCRMPKTAAMIGLAISMGATSLLVTRQSDQAVAAEPLGNLNTASTIPADTEVKFASTKKLDSPVVSSVSVPENPAIVEPTAISQVPRLSAKWQVTASRTSVQAAAPMVPNSPKATEEQSIALETTNVQQSEKLGVQTLSHTSSIAGVRTVSSVSAQEQIAAANTLEPEVNAQLKAQQEFALNRLQEKSNRLRKSLANWRSIETKDLSQQATATQFSQPMTVAQMTQSTSLSAIEQSETTSNVRTKLVSKLKQSLEEQVSLAPEPTPASTPAAVVAPKVVAPTVNATKYEVKPGDTLAAIALNYKTSISEIVKANNLNNPHQLKISQRLSIPVAENVTTASQTDLVSGGTTKLNDTIVGSVIGNNKGVAVPTPIIADNYDNDVESTTADSAEDTTANQTTSYGVGGDSPVPKVFTEMQLAQTSTPTAAKQVKNSQRLRSLHEEIEKLRAKYRSQQTGNAVVVPEVSQNNDAPVAVPVSSQNDSVVPISVPKPNDTAVQIPVNRSSTAAIPIPVPRPMTPSYGATGQPSNRANRRPVNEPINPELLQNQAAVNPSVGGDASQSLGVLRGRTVSPQLPPLAAVDRYLPRPIDETTPPPSTSSTAYIWPAKGVLTSGYGWRWGRMHRGIDIANSTGTPIYAAADGVVEKAGWNKGGYGNLVDIRHADGSMSRYGHNSKLLVQPGQQVQQGQTIALMGSTGFSTGPHSHFEIHPAGKGAVNPVALLPGRV